MYYIFEEYVRIVAYYTLAYVHALTLYRTVSCGVRQTHALWAGTVTTFAVLISPKLHRKRNKRKMPKYQMISRGHLSFAPHHINSNLSYL